MFSLNQYKRDCDNLCFRSTDLEEMISVAEKKQLKNRKTFRSVALVAACVAVLSMTAMAQEPVRGMIEQAMVYLVKTVNNGEDKYNYFASSVYTPPMSYEEQNGRMIFTVDGKATDVTEAIERDGYYDCKWDDANLHLTAEGLVTYTRLDENGNIWEEITLDLLNGGNVVYTPLEGEEVETDKIENSVDLTDVTDFELGEYNSEQ